MYSIGKPARRLKRDEAVLTVSVSAITVNDYRSTKTFTWKEVQDFIVTNDDGTQYLVLKTFYGEEKVGISWLDKKPAEIKKLIEEYRSQAASRYAPTE